MSLRLLVVLAVGGCSDYGLEAQLDVIDAPECPPDLAREADIAVDPTCDTRAVVPVEDPWRARLEWFMEMPETYRGAGLTSSSPLVVQLSDDDGDGDVDGGDDPDLVLAYHNGIGEDHWNDLVCLDGTTGEEVWRKEQATGGWLAAGDVDGDGVPEILSLNPVNRLQVMDAGGTTLWTSLEHPYGNPTPLVVDLEGDGDVEVVMGAHVHDGATGEILLTLEDGESWSHAGALVADIDLDGVQELIRSTDVVDPTTGEVEWTADVPALLQVSTAVLEADGDPEAEVVFLGDRLAEVRHHDGTLLHRFAMEARVPSLPCVADFDGDGLSEIAAGLDREVAVMEPDGEVLWSWTWSDVSAAGTTCTAFDLDRDGQHELLWGEAEGFFVFDGASGEVLLHEALMPMAWSTAQPVVADWDRDGAAEILLGVQKLLHWSDEIVPGVAILGHDGEGWAEAGTTWTQHPFVEGMVGQDGSVAPPVPWWLHHDVLRGRPSPMTAGVDLDVTITDACATSCGDAGSVMVAVQVCNTGNLVAPPGIDIALYRDVGGTLESLQTTATHEAIDGGHCAAGVSFTLDAREVREGDLLVRVDDDGSRIGVVVECDESDNRDRAPSPCAP